jgi:hypothetical protein
MLRHILAACLSLAALLHSSTAAPVRLIYDTDIQTDCDDVAALAVLHALADKGELEILATMVCVLHPWAAACTDAVNTYYGRPDLPLGVLKGPGGVNLPSKYAEGIAKAFPNDAATTAVDATGLYRKILSKEPDGSVVLLSVGYMTNLSRLLHSPADAISPLTGEQLIRQKVKTWICMGGNFPDDAAKDSNVNFRRDPRAVIDCLANWPGSVVFVGREIGHNMRAGARLKNLPENNPVRRAYELFFNGPPKDHHCADIAAVLYAARGLSNYWKLQDKGSVNFIGDDSKFQWVEAPDKDQAYLLRDMPPAEIQELLEDLMIQPPRAAQSKPR